MGINVESLSKGCIWRDPILIFVVLGTHELPFTRIIKEVEKLKKEGFIKDKVIVQNGHTKYKSDVMELKPFINFNDMDKLYEEAKLIITHAGTGSVITPLKKGKKVIVAPRLSKFGEHNDDHQLELVEAFEKSGHILAWYENDSLKDILKKVESFHPKPFESKKELMLKTLQEFIDNI